MTDIIPELLDICETYVFDTETVYKPIDGPSDKYIHERLEICQGGIYRFHWALQRGGKPIMKGEA